MCAEQMCIVVRWRHAGGAQEPFRIGTPSSHLTHQTTPASKARTSTPLSRWVQHWRRSHRPNAKCPANRCPKRHLRPIARLHSSRRSGQKQSLATLACARGRAAMTVRHHWPQCFWTCRGRLRRRGSQLRRPPLGHSDCAHSSALSLLHGGGACI